MYIIDMIFEVLTRFEFEFGLAFQQCPITGLA